MTSAKQGILQEQDIAYTLLCDLKRVVREYATAATESTCNKVRELNTQLLNNALKSQGDLFNAMKEAQLYDQPLYASKSDLQQQLTSYKQTATKLDQFISQHQVSQQGSNSSATSATSISS